jgi:hypothetical protein
VRGLDVPVRAMAVYRHDLIVGGYAVFSGWGFGPYAIPLLGVFDGRSWRDMSGEVGSFGCAALAIYDDELVAGGGVNGGCGYEFPYNGAVLSWNGRSWTPRTGDSGVTSGAIGTLVEWDGRLIAGGGFEAVNGVVTGRAAAWDGSAWSALGSAVRRRSELVAFRDELITEGAITRAGGNRDGITGLVSWNGRSWKNIGPEFPFSQGCLTVGLCPGACVIGGNTSIAFPLGTFRDRLLIGGYIGDWYAARCVFAWDGSATSPVGEGLNGAALRMVEYHDRLIMVGPLSLNAVDLRGVVTWDGTSWASLGTEHPDFSYSVTDMTVYDDTVILAVWGTAPDRLRTWDGISWSYLGDGLQATIGGIRAFCTYRDRLIAGGVFTVAGGVGANHIAAWNGSSWEPLGSGLDGPVLALAVYDGRVVAGGDFTAAGGLPANHLAAWDGETWSPLGSGVNGLVNQIVPFRGDLVVEGTFTMAGGKSSPYLATWSTKDEVEAAFDVKPGACPNPINGSVDGGAGKSVVPAAILGSAGFDVHEIDPSTVTVNGEPVIRWGYEDVGSPGDGPEDECACPGTGGDGYDDLTLKVSRAALVASLNEVAGGSGESPGRASAGAVPGPPDRARYTVRVQGRLEDGTGFHGSDCVVLVGPGTEYGGAEAEDAPGVDVLGNDPNPFDRKTRISFRLATSTPVRLEVFDVAGRRVATLADGVMGAGRQSIAWDGSRAASGIYYYRLKAGDQILTRRMLLLK